MMNVFKFIVVIFSLAFSLNLFSDDGLTVVAIGKAELEKEKFLVQHPILKGTLHKNEMQVAERFLEKIRNDFSFYIKYFSVLSPDSERSTDLNYTFWKAKGIKYLVQVQFSSHDTQLSFNLNAFDISKSESLVSTKGFLSKDNVDQFAHESADEIYRAITGKKSIFTSKIVFVSDRNSTSKETIKELYIMDFDGGNAKQLTHHGGIVISPAISYDGKRILYSLIQENNRTKRNINLWMYSLVTGRSEKISSQNGINSGAVFHPDGEHILLTLSHVGNAEIFKMNLKSKKLTQITHDRSPDVDPSVSIDGNLMTFLSGRSGKPMIYTLALKKGEKAKRISYVGEFNATPRFSPDGKNIVFSSWLDNRFDIFRIGADGHGLSRLTKDFGSNEDPTYSNDGLFIAFSSQRVISQKKADQNIYIMDKDGEIIGPVTSRYGNCITPRWSK